MDKDKVFNILELNVMWINLCFMYGIEIHESPESDLTGYGEFNNKY